MIFRNAVARPALVLAIFCLGGCSGGSGDRSETIVSGNVRSATATAAMRPRTLWQLVESWWSAEVQAQVPGITVAILNSSTSARTDDLGFFRLEGREFGPVLLQFTGPGLTATLGVTLPAGGELDLINVDIAGGRVSFDEQRIRFDGPVTGLDCEGNILQLLSGALVPFRVRILPTTALIDQDGRPLPCQNLGIGRNADVQGVVDDDGVVDAVEIRANPAPAVTPIPLGFEGNITARNCPVSIDVLRGETSVEVDIDSGTLIREQSGEPLACSALNDGDGVHVEGTETSFGVDASLIERLPPPTPTPLPTATATPEL
ncbi:MAG: carboxypeptidase-like regulatory domain-containing protein [Candidatus Binatia bacterium]